MISCATYRGFVDVIIGLIYESGLSNDTERDHKNIRIFIVAPNLYHSQYFHELVMIIGWDIQPDHHIIVIRTVAD